MDRSIGSGHLEELVGRAHFFSVNGKYFFILKHSRQSFECSKEFYDFRTTAGTSESLENKFVNEIGLLKSFSYLNVDIDEHYKKKYRDNSLALLSLGMITDCNLACTYCSVGPSGSYGKKVAVKMPFETAKSAIDYLVTNSKRKELQLIFFGGEPMMNWECIKQILEYTQRNYGGIGWHYFLISNGTLFTRENVKALSSYDVTALVTLTGTPEMHNRSRINKDGKGTWRNVYDGLQLLKDAGVDYITKAVVTPEDAHSLDVVRNIMESIDVVGNSRINLGYEHKHAYGNREKYYGEEDESTSKYINSLRGEDKKPNYFSNLDTAVLWGEWGYDALCGAGRTSLFIAPEGNVYSCHITAGSGCDHYRMGNVNYKVNEERRLEIKELFEYEKNKCSRCWANSLCTKECSLYRIRVDELEEGFCNPRRSIYEKTVYHCSLFDIDHISEFVGRYTKWENMERLRHAYNLRETLKKSLKHIFPVHIFPAVRTPSVAVGGMEICR